MGRGIFSRYLAGCAVALALCLMPVSRAHAGLSEEKISGKDLSALTPTPTSSAAVTPTTPEVSVTPADNTSADDNDSDSDDNDSDADQSDADNDDAAVAATSLATPGARRAPGAIASPITGATISSIAGALNSPAAAATAALGPPPALDLSASSPPLDLGAASLAPEIRKAANPARAASLRLTEAARKELEKNQTDAALRELARAISIDGGNPFAYYYFGRSYVRRRNFAQALIFFRHAELGFAARSDWLGETLSYEGSCEEALGRRGDAAKAYQRAVAAAPRNFRAQAGYQRLGPAIAPVHFNLPPPPSGDIAPPPPPSGDAALPPPITAPAPPPEEEPTPAPAAAD